MISYSIIMVIKMRLVREAAGKEYTGKRHAFRIIGTAEDKARIEHIEYLLGQCLTGNMMFSEYHQKMVPETYYHRYSDWCAGDEYYGGGCCWYVDIENIEEFKSNWIDIKRRIQ